MEKEKTKTCIINWAVPDFSNEPMKKPFAIFSIVLLIYMLWPGPKSIGDFPALPNSSKSTLEGDTIHVPNVAGYFSNNYRDFSTNYYRDFYSGFTKLPLLPLRLNHPPEFAYTAIKDQTHSTYLEEFIYPLRESLFVNGLEPYLSDGTPKFSWATKFEADEKEFDTKVTIRFYPAPIWVKFLVWLGICASVALVWKYSRRVFLDE